MCLWWVCVSNGKTKRRAAGGGRSRTPFLPSLFIQHEPKTSRRMKTAKSLKPHLFFSFFCSFPFPSPNVFERRKWQFSHSFSFLKGLGPLASFSFFGERSRPRTKQKEEKEEEARQRFVRDHGNNVGGNTGHVDGSGRGNGGGGESAPPTPSPVYYKPVQTEPPSYGPAQPQPEPHQPSYQQEQQQQQPAQEEKKEESTYPPPPPPPFYPPAPASASPSNPPAPPPSNSPPAPSSYPAVPSLPPPPPPPPSSYDPAEEEKQDKPDSQPYSFSYAGQSSPGGGEGQPTGGGGAQQQQQQPEGDPYHWKLLNHDANESVRNFTATGKFWSSFSFLIFLMLSFSLRSHRRPLPRSSTTLTN